MRAVWVASFGAPEALERVNVADPRPAANAVVVEIKAIGLGSMDAAARRGGSYFASSPGFIPGYEVAGTVIELGAGVDHSWRGRRVYAVLRQGGGCAERVSVPMEELIDLPDQIGFEDAVATGLNALVAQVGLARVPVTDTDRVLVRGAGGGIGLMCVQYAALRARTIVATTSSDYRGKRLLALGASSIWNRLADDQQKGETFDIVVDTVVGHELPAFLDRLRTDGRYLLCGGLDGLPPSDFGMKLIEHFHRSPTLFAFSLNSASVDAVAREASILFEHVQAGRITAVVDSVMPLTAVVEAHRRLDEGRAFGKIILSPD